MSDRDLGELHAFARTIRLRYLSYQGDHYDVPEGLFDRAVQGGADVVDSRELLRRLRSSGLRRRCGKRATTWSAVFDGSVVDAARWLASTRATVLTEVARRHGPVASAVILERPGEQVGLLHLVGEGRRLDEALEVLDADCVVVESDDPRGHTVEVVWRSGAGRELDHR